MPEFNQLTSAEEERMILLVEEAAEVIQAATKILRHGFDSRNPLLTDSPTNRTDLETELGHLMHSVDLLTAAIDVDVTRIEQARDRKRLTIGPYLHHQPIG